MAPARRDDARHGAVRLPRPARMRLSPSKGPPVLWHLRNPSRGYDQDGREITPDRSSKTSAETLPAEPFVRRRGASLTDALLRPFERCPLKYTPTDRNAVRASPSLGSKTQRLDRAKTPNRTRVAGSLSGSAPCHRAKPYWNGREDCFGSGLPEDLGFADHKKAPRDFSRGAV
jgi:hypothetical protein